MILFALLVPALMMGFLFGTTALEKLLFPHPTSNHSTDEDEHDVTDP